MFGCNVHSLFTFLVLILNGEAIISTARNPSNSDFKGVEDTIGGSSNNNLTFESKAIGTEYVNKTCVDALLRLGIILEKVKFARERLTKQSKMTNAFIEEKVLKTPKAFEERFRREYRLLENFFHFYEKAIDEVRDVDYEECIARKKLDKCESTVFKDLLDCAWLKPDKRWILGNEMESKKSKNEKVFWQSLNVLTNSITDARNYLKNINKTLSEAKIKCNQSDCECLQEVETKIQKNDWENIERFNRTEWTIEVDNLLTAWKEGLPDYNSIKKSTIELVRLYSCCLNSTGITIKGFPCDPLSEPSSIKFPTDLIDD